MGNHNVKCSATQIETIKFENQLTQQIAVQNYQSNSIRIQDFSNKAANDDNRLTIDLIR